MSAATDRLALYNGDVYDAATNPRGFDGADGGVSGLEANLPQALNDVGTAAAEIADLIGTNRAVGPSLAYAWDAGTTDADPGTGKARANHATLSSATALFISTTDAGGATVSAVLDAFDDGTSTLKGRLRLAHRTDATVWGDFAVTGAVVSATGYRKVTVAWVAGSGTLAAADPVALGFVRTGDKGDTGSATWGAGSASAPGLAPSGDSDTGFFAPAANTVAVSVGGTERARFASDGTITLGAAVGAESLRVAPIASAVNRLQVSGAASGAPVLVEAAGADSSIGIRLQGKGNHGIGANTDPDDKVSLRVARGVVVLQGVLGLPSFGCGLDYSGSARHFIVGNYPHRFFTDGLNAEQLRILHTAATDRWVEVTGSLGGAPAIGTSAGDLVLSPATGVVTGIESAWLTALSDETTALATGTGVVTVRAPFAMTLTKIPRSSVGVVSSSGLVTVDIKVGGSTILGSNKLSIDASEKTSTTAATATTLVTTSISDDAEFTFDITAAGTGAKGLKVCIFFKR